MRKEYGKLLRNLFSREMKIRLPQFESVKIKSAYLFPGERIFRWIPESSLHCFITLTPHHKGYDEFTVEIGWSELERFPELSMRPSTMKPYDDNVLSCSESVCRLIDICPSCPEWWKFDYTEDPLEMLLKQSAPICTEKAQKEVALCVEDAIEKTVSYGVPYLKKVAEYKSL